MPQLAAACQELDRDWRSYFEVPVTADLCRQAGVLAEEYALRGFDSVQLASYAELMRGATVDGPDFLTFDLQLARAAKQWQRRFRRERWAMRRRGL